MCRFSRLGWWNLVLTEPFLSVLNFECCKLIQAWSCLQILCGSLFWDFLQFFWRWIVEIVSKFERKGVCCTKLWFLVDSLMSSPWHFFRLYVVDFHILIFVLFGLNLHMSTQHGFVWSLDSLGKAFCCWWVFLEALLGTTRGEDVVDTVLCFWSHVMYFHIAIFPVRTNSSHLNLNVGLSGDWILLARFYL